MEDTETGREREGGRGRIELRYRGRQTDIHAGREGREGRRGWSGKKEGSKRKQTTTVLIKQSRMFYVYTCSHCTEHINMHSCHYYVRGQGNPWQLANLPRTWKA